MNHPTGTRVKRPASIPAPRREVVEPVESGTERSSTEGSHADWQRKAMEILSDGKPHQTAEFYEAALKIKPSVIYGTVASWLQRQADDKKTIDRGEGRGVYVLRSKD